ncbi:serine/threonine-protein kinase PLK4-like, partial [Watersipora subatra]|uniref:serine/threonine-protein kinase PLK4-like n=1 Tax=Watersipora subatra TaxID=2589382 RepID=UPI00355C3E62
FNLKQAICDYEILNLVGRGGFACVYKGRQKTTGDIVAIKVIEKRRMKSSGMIDCVKKEVEIHSRLKHPSILELYSFCEDSNYVYLILEMCSKGELYSYVSEQTTPLSYQQVKKFMEEVVSGMQYLHTHAILHRDLSLTNLLLTEDLHVKIADFGLATKLSQPGEQHFTLCGTPNYISPEVATRAAHSLETDLWSLGCMLYTMLVGQPPFDAEGAQPTLNRVIAGEYDLPSHVSECASHLIQSLLQKNPADRLGLDQILIHPFFMDAEIVQNDSAEDSGYKTIDSTISPVRKVTTTSPVDICRSVDKLRPPIWTPVSVGGDSLPTAVAKPSPSNCIMTTPSFTACQLDTKPKVSSPATVGCCLLTPLIPSATTAVTSAVTTAVTSAMTSTQTSDANIQSTQRPHICTHQQETQEQAAQLPQGPAGFDGDTKEGSIILEKEQLHWMCAKPLTRMVMVCKTRWQSSRRTIFFLPTNSPYQTINNMKQHTTISGASVKPLLALLFRQLAGDDHHPVVVGRAGLDLDEPDFTSTPITDHPPRSKPSDTATARPKPVVIAEFDLSSNNIIQPIREALLKAFPAAEKKPPSTSPLKGVLATIHKRCRVFLEKCATRSPTGRNCKSKEMRKPHGMVSPLLSPISQNKVIQSAGVLCSPPVHTSRPGREGKATLQPFTSERLRPIRQRTRNAIVNILDNGDVRLEFLKSRSPTAAITEIFNISWDGTQVSIYRPVKGSVSLPAGTTDTPTALPSTANKYTNVTLPKKYWKKYLYASRFIKMVKSKTPKVTYFSDQAKCMLMESAEEFEAVFYSGPKFTISSQHVKVIDTTGMNISFDTESESSLLSAEVHDMWQHIKMCREHCLNLEKMLTTAEHSSSADSSHFPVIIGSRWTANSCLPDSTAPREPDFDTLPPTMCSFDGSLMSSATTFLRTRPTRLSPEERHIVLPPYQKTVSITTSEESSQILLRRHVKNIGYASQLKNGAVCVQFDDGYQLTVYAHKSEVTFVYTSGVISRFTEKDELPDIVRSKLESLGHVISSLAAMHGPLSSTC